MYQPKLIPTSSRIFVNRTLNLNQIKLVGFDMDYTVVSYNVPAFQDDGHQEGSLKGQVIKDPKTFLIQKPLMIEGLKKLRQCGKKIALITDSDYEYSQARLLRDFPACASWCSSGCSSGSCRRWV
jgi:hypothetical protein